MIQNNLLLDAAAIVYPESDGLPMADNSRQLRWMVVLFGNLSALFRNQRVFVGANHFWYPVENHPEDRIAPDVFVVFDRPKGDRPSYQQWKEDHIPVTIAFEVLSPGNTIFAGIEWKGYQVYRTLSDGEQFFATITSLAVFTHPLRCCWITEIRAISYAHYRRKQSGKSAYSR